MTDCNTKLMEALLSGGNVDEIFRQEIENAVNVLLEAEIKHFWGMSGILWKAPIPEIPGMGAILGRSTAAMAV